MAWTGTVLNTVQWKNGEAGELKYVAGKAQREASASPSGARTGRCGLQVTALVIGN
jgi:hypothetical protein